LWQKNRGEKGGPTGSRGRRQVRKPFFQTDINGPLIQGFAVTKRAVLRSANIRAKGRIPSGDEGSSHPRVGLKKAKLLPEAVRGNPHLRVLWHRQNIRKGTEKKHTVFTAMRNMGTSVKTGDVWEKKGRGNLHSFELDRKKGKKKWNCLAKKTQSIRNGWEGKKKQTFLEGRPEGTGVGIDFSLQCQMRMVISTRIHPYDTLLETDSSVSPVQRGAPPSYSNPLRPRGVGIQKNRVGALFLALSLGGVLGGMAPKLSLGEGSFHCHCLLYSPQDGFLFFLGLCCFHSRQGEKARQCDI